MFSTSDHTHMAQALRLAERGLYTTSPNPRVGCIVVKNNQIVGQGAHYRAGEPHAEIYALQEAGIDAIGADVYVTLEPCHHYGRTPPCTEALQAAKVKRVIVAMPDPNPLVAGKGISHLQSLGIVVDVGLMQREAAALNPGFISRMTRGRPYVRSKIAASLDGRTALKNGQSQWITNGPARIDVQHWRAQSCAIITGIGSILADDPVLNVLGTALPSDFEALNAPLSDAPALPPRRRQPLRVVVDSSLQTPVMAKILNDAREIASPVMIAHAVDVNQVNSFVTSGNDKRTSMSVLNDKAAALMQQGATLTYLPGDHGRVDLNALLKHLAQLGINEVLLEAGQGLNGGFLQTNLIDEFIFYYAPKLMGTDAKGMFAITELTNMQSALDLHIIDLRQVGQDIRVRAKPLK